ncbi:UNVERIFIED_CONTAM: hypothetical protein NCL1_47113 [Trichonephila clavipes]
MDTPFGHEFSNGATAFRKDRGHDCFLARITTIFSQKAMTSNKRSDWTHTSIRSNLSDAGVSVSSKTIRSRLVDTETPSITQITSG